MIRLASRGDVATQVQLPPEVVHATALRLTRDAKPSWRDPAWGLTRRAGYANP